jgi:hypothetical protein
LWPAKVRGEFGLGIDGDLKTIAQIREQPIDHRSQDPAKHHSEHLPKNRSVQLILEIAFREERVRCKLSAFEKVSRLLHSFGVEQMPEIGVFVSRSPQFEASSGCPHSGCSVATIRGTAPPHSVSDRPDHCFGGDLSRRWQ